jgi:hypothetical protein
MKMWWMVIPGLAGIIAMLSGKKSGGGEGAKSGGPTYTVSDWTPLISSMAKEARIPAVFCLSWIKHESGGNPCSFGSASSKGPDGHPREQGIAQLYNPDDFEKFDIKSGALRVYCVPGTQQCSRRLTDSEMKEHALANMKLILRCREVAGQASAKNGLHWKGKDIYKLVKLVHGLPGLVKSGMALVVKSLGRPPKDWQEFKVAVDKTKMDDGTEKYRSLFPKLFANAEKVAADLPDDVKVVS